MRQAIRHLRRAVSEWHQHTAASRVYRVCHAVTKGTVDVCEGVLASPCLD
jgi:hypothetical protein